MFFFAEVQFLPEISYDSKGGPEFSTDIVSTFSGYNSVTLYLQMARAKYDISSGINTEDSFSYILATSYFLLLPKNSLISLTNL